MCGRFTLRASGEAVAKEFALVLLEPLPARYNIAPLQAVLVVCTRSARVGAKPVCSHPLETPEPKQTHSAGTGGSDEPSVSELGEEQQLQAQALPERQLVWMQWGLHLVGPKGPKVPHPLINLRVETALEVFTLRGFLQHRRCLIVADGFYEWEKIGRSRQAFFIHRKDDRPFGMAGVWKPAPSAEPGQLPECVVLTIPANSVVEPIHARMPALLLPEHYSIWLHPAEEHLGEVARVLRPYPPELLEAYPVSDRVNSTEYESPECTLRQDTPVQKTLFDSGE